MKATFIPFLVWIYW